MLLDLPGDSWTLLAPSGSLTPSVSKKAGIPIVRPRNSLCSALGVSAYNLKTLSLTDGREHFPSRQRADLSNFGSLGGHQTHFRAHFSDFSETHPGHFWAAPGRPSAPPGCSWTPLDAPEASGTTSGSPEAIATTNHQRGIRGTPIWRPILAIPARTRNLKTLPPDGWPGRGSPKSFRSQKLPGAPRLPESPRSQRLSKSPRGSH